MSEQNSSGNIIDTLGQLGLGIANTVLGSTFGDKNYELQKDMSNYQKELNRTIFAREDTAVQRRSSDIRAAGGNPALAYMNGISGAGAGGTVSAPKAAQYDISGIQRGLSQFSSAFTSVGQLEANILANKQRRAEIEKVDADISKTKAETLTEMYRRLGIIENTAKTRSEKEKINASKKELLHNLDWYIERDLPTSARMPSVLNYAHGFFEEVGASDMSVKDKFLLVAEVAGAAVIGTAGLKAVNKFLDGIKNSPKLIGRAYDYVKTHGISGVKTNFDDFKDFVINGPTFNQDKEFKVNKPIQFGVKGYKK